MAEYLQDAVHTKIGYAHPLTGEQLTATKGLDNPVTYYDPNSGDHSFIDPEGEISSRLAYQRSSLRSLSVSFTIQAPGKPIDTVDWTFENSEVVAGGKSATHVFSDDGTYTVSAEITYVDETTETLTADVVVGSEYVDPPAAPENTDLPTITGTAQVGQTLTANDGTWTGNPAPTFTYQWMSGASNIAGATEKTYLVEAGDEGSKLKVKVKGTNSEGTATASSAQTDPVIAA